MTDSSPPLSSEAPRDKATLRALLRQQRATLPLEVWRQDSDAIVRHVEQYVRAQRITSVALYAPLEKRREVDVSPLDGWLRARGARVAYPFMRGPDLGFAWVSAPNDLCALGGFPQPHVAAQRAKPGELGLIVVPALAATPHGLRLGYGSGFYDRVLPTYCPPGRALCVVFENQVLRELPVSPYDVACAGVITETGLLGGSPENG